MEVVISEYITCIIEAAMTIVFCLLVTRDGLKKQTGVLALTVAMLSVLGGAASMGLAAGLATLVPVSLDFSMLSLPFWFAADFFLLRWVTRESPDGLLMVLLLSVQTLHLCRSVTPTEQVLIRMENGCGGMVYQEGERFLSGKPGRNRAEGVGIASVRAVAAKYEGMADFTYTPDTLPPRCCSIPTGFE